MQASICSIFFDHAARQDDSRWPGYTWDRAMGAAAEVNRALGRSPAIQNISSCGSCRQMALHVDWLLTLAEEALSLGDAPEFRRRQGAALRDLFRAFFAADAFDGPALFFFHEWCVTDQTELACHGITLRDVPRSATRQRLGQHPVRLRFDPAGYRSIAVDHARFRWTAGPRYEASDLRPVRLTVDRRRRRGSRMLAASHCEQLGLAELGSEFTPMLQRGLFPYRCGKTLPCHGAASVIHDFPAIRAARLRPMRVEAGMVVQAVEESLVVLLDRESGSVARISAKYDQFIEGVFNAAPPEQSSLWPLLRARRAERSLC